MLERGSLGAVGQAANSGMKAGGGWERFRVTDPRDPAAQARLVRLIEAAGLPHVVAPDGSLLVPDDREAIRFLEDFLDSLFPDGWGHAQVRDPAFVERYRRFTARHGTVIVEKTIGGEPYVVQAVHEKLYRSRGIPTHVSFIIHLGDRDPGVVTSRLGLTPTVALRRGEPFVRPFSGRRPDAPARPCWSGWWELCSLPDIQSNELSPHLAWLLGRLEPVADRLAEFAKGGPAWDGRILQVDIVEPAGSVGGLNLDSDMLRRLSVVVDSVQVRHWPDDYL